MQKCLWCHGKIDETGGIPVQYDFGPEAFCSKPCQEKFNWFYQYARSRISHLISLVILVSIIGVFVTFWRMEIDNGALGTFICFAGLGAVVLRYPIVTPQTVRHLGGRRSIVLARRMGYFCIAFGTVCAAAVYYFG